MRQWHDQIYITLVPTQDCTGKSNSRDREEFSSSVVWVVMTNWKIKTKSGGRVETPGLIWKTENEEDSRPGCPFSSKWSHHHLQFSTCWTVSSVPGNLNSLKAASFVISYFPLTMWVFVDHDPWQRSQKQGSGNSASSPPCVNILPPAQIIILIIAVSSPFNFLIVYCILQMSELIVNGVLKGMCYYKWTVYYKYQLF